MQNIIHIGPFYMENAFVWIARGIEKRHLITWMCRKMINSTFILPKRFICVCFPSKYYKIYKIFNFQHICSKVTLSKWILSTWAKTILLDIIFAQRISLSTWCILLFWIFFANDTPWKILSISVHFVWKMFLDGFLLKYAIIAQE